MVGISEIIDLLRSKAKLIVGIFILTLVFGTSFSDLLFSSKRELIYEYDITAYIS
jgi:hypothetical protein